jgi:hypothetical protein
MNFKHYVLVPLLFFMRNTRQNQEYLDYRLKLFEKYFIHGVNSQTNKNFELCILASESYRNLDFSGFEKLSNTNIFFIPDGKGHKDSIEYLLKDEDYNLDFVLTTRTDSDDIWPVYFIDGIQNTFKEVKDECLIDYKSLIKSNEDFSDYGHLIYRCNSMFLTSAFKPSNFKTKNCFADQHSYMPKHFNKNIIINALGGACICHGKNLLNTVRGEKVNFDIKKIYNIG